MSLLNKYLLREFSRSTFGLVVVAVGVLLLERLLRIFEIVSISQQANLDAIKMVVNLLPHYLGIAIPVAVMIGTILTIDRFSRSRELTATYGAGISLLDIVKPFFLLAVVMAIGTLLVEGYFQPLSRYKYRGVVHSIKQNSAAAALNAGKFVTDKNTTLHTGSTKGGPVFILEDRKNGNVRITTATDGNIVPVGNSDKSVLNLKSGVILVIAPDKTINHRVEFESIQLDTSQTQSSFRPRGDDERELTTIELLQNRESINSPISSLRANAAALHSRIARAALILILPLVALPFGINYGRNPSYIGVFFGITFLVFIQKTMAFGQALGTNGTLPAWAGIWPFMIVLFLFAFFLFRRSAQKIGEPPLSSISMLTTKLAKGAYAKVCNCVRRQHQ